MHADAWCGPRVQGRLRHLVERARVCRRAEALCWRLQQCVALRCVALLDWTGRLTLGAGSGCRACSSAWMPLGGWASAAFCWHHFTALKALTRQSSAPDGAGISARLLGRNQGCGWTARNAAWIDADFCGVLVSRSCAGGASVARSGAERAHRQHRACRYACAMRSWAGNRGA